MKKLDRGIAKLEDLAGAFCLGVVVVMTLINVFCRYVLSIGILWSDEVISLALIWMAMLGSARAVRVYEHVDIPFIPNHLPHVPQKVLRIMSSLLTVVFLCFVVVCAVMYCNLNMKARTTVLKIPKIWCYSALVAGGALMFYEFLKTIPWRLRGEVNPKAIAESGQITDE